MFVRKKVITLTALLVILSGLVTALWLLRDDTADLQESSSEDFWIEVLRFSAPIAEISVTPPEGAAYTIKNLADSVAQHEENPTSTLLGREELPVDTTKTNSLISSSALIQSTRLLFESVDDYAPFGLTKPRATVKLTDMDGVSATLLIGNEATGGDGVYLQVEGRPAIFLVPAYLLASYLLPETGYISLTATPGSAWEGELSFERITLGGTVRGELGEIVVQSSPEDTLDTAAHSYSLNTPVSRAADSDAVMTLFHPLLGMQASEVFALSPDEALLSRCGLDEPYATVAVESAEYGDFTLLAGEPDHEGKVYFMREGVPVLYVESISRLPWLETQFYDIMNRNVTSLILDEISEIIVTTDSRTYSFTLNRDSGGFLTVNADGSEVDLNSFMTFCESLQSLKFEEYTPEPLSPEDVPALQIAIGYVSGTPDDVISFYPGPIRKYRINTGDMDFNFHVAASHVDGLISQAQLAAGE